MKKPDTKTKNTIIRAVEKLISNYGFRITRQVINRYFKNELEKKKLTLQIKKQEAELKALKEQNT